MNDFIRKLFDDEDLAINRFPKNSTAAAELTRERGRLYNRLKERLSPEDLELLQEYIDCSTNIQEEYEYMAFCCGLRCSAEFFMGVFSD